jgi:hypothetical protein
VEVIHGIFHMVYCLSVFVCLLFDFEHLFYLLKRFLKIYKLTLPAFEQLNQLFQLCIRDLVQLLFVGMFTHENPCLMLNLPYHLSHKLILFLPDDFTTLIQSQKRTEIVRYSLGQVRGIFGNRMKVQQ